MPRAGLNRERVVRAGADMIESDGLGALTLSRLAQNLGVASPSLYKHIEGLDDLIERIAVRGVTELTDVITEATVGKSGQSALVALATAYREFARTNPGVYPITQRVNPTSSHEFRSAADRAVTTVVACLSDYQLSNNHRIAAVRLVRSALHGFVDLESHGGFGLPESVEDTFTRLIHMLHTALLDFDEEGPNRESE